ncbi:MAG: hypothetical protein JXR48_05525 [Candidatus Delongbacteria bacterium]|nr:hypothetical protein [Candidatus Delongbacteria bacterium]MBN2834409.1 hypothetical protein [Candidatus Delongbacteria bacterium]
MKVITFLTMIILVSLFADKAEVIENIKAAQKNVERGDLKEAKSDLQMALSAIEQMQFEKLKEYLPKAPVGWNEEKATGSNMGSLGLGMMAGTTASKNYYKEEGETYRSVNIDLVLNSPLVGTLKMFLNNPAMLSMDPEQKLIRLSDGRKVLMKYNADDMSGEISIIADTSVITINGSMVDEDTLKMFANMIKVDEILNNL